MKLPDPVAVMDRDGDVYKALPTPNWHPPHTNLYSETQLRAEIERRDAVLRVAQSSLEEACGDRCNAEYNPCYAREAIKAINDVLSDNRTQGEER